VLKRITVGLFGALLVVPILAPLLLRLVGFSSIGPVAGTWAAGFQAGIGNVAAGSAFAVAQGVAMGASVPPLIQVLVGIVFAFLA
jgi:hypothetical protein